MIAAGIDVGSRTIKVALVRRGRRRPLASLVADQGIDQRRIIERVFAGALRQAGLSARQVQGVLATGYGRNAVGFADSTATEITCLARAVHAELPACRAIIDIGGQDSKVIWLSSEGQVHAFAMNDRCAAGTGRFLEMVAVRLGIGLIKLGTLAAAGKPCPINSTCAVFAESEITGLLAAGVEPGRIAAGVHAAIAERIDSLAGRRNGERAVFTGGVALVPGMRKALESRLGVVITVPRSPQTMGAAGAALLALDACRPKEGREGGRSGGLRSGEVRSGEVRSPR